MKSKEISRFIEFELKGRWRDWEATSAQLHDIQSWFENISYEQAAKAASQVRSENGYKTPDIGRIAGLCKQMTEQHRSDTKIPVYAVWQDGMIKTFWHTISGLVELDYQRAEEISRALSLYLTDGKHFLNHGDFTLYVGEQNYQYAIERVKQNRDANYANRKLAI